jgi:hypothetical protein
LEELDCSSCQIKNIHNYPNLKLSRMENCPITIIPKFAKLERLICTISKIEEIPEIDTLLELYCCCCKNLKSIPDLPSLFHLSMGSTNIKTIPSFKNLQTLQCMTSLLVSIPMLPNLKTLNCSYSNRLVTIKNNSLKYMSCHSCKLLVDIPNCDVVEIYNSPCVKYKKQIYKLYVWIKNNFRYFVFSNWIKSKQGKEFLYHPDNIGGRIEKTKLKKIFESFI